MMVGDILAIHSIDVLLTVIDGRAEQEKHRDDRFRNGEYQQARFSG